MLTVRVPPTTTEIGPATEAVATTESLLPVGRGMPPIGLLGGLLPPVPEEPPETASLPLLVPTELEPQPPSSSSKQTPRGDERGPSTYLSWELSWGHEVKPAVAVAVLTASRNTPRVALWT